MSETVTIRRETLVDLRNNLEDAKVNASACAHVIDALLAEASALKPAAAPHPWMQGWQPVRAVEVEMAIGAAMVAHVTGIHQRDEQAMREFVQAAVSEAIAAHIQTAHLPANYVTTTARP